EDVKRSGVRSMARVCPYCGVLLPDEFGSFCPGCRKPIGHPKDEGDILPSERIQARENGSDISFAESRTEDILVKVWDLNSPEEAELARVYLEARGIKAVFAGGVDGITNSLGVPLGGMLKVRKHDAKRAARLLKIAALRKKQDPALPLNRPFKLMLAGAA